MIVGGVLLLSRLDVLDPGPVVDLWPLALVVLGVARLWASWGTQDGGSGAWLLLTGVWFLAVNFRVLGMTIANSWPMLLVGGGGAMIIRALLTGRRVSTGEEVGHGG